MVKKILYLALLLINFSGQVNAANMLDGFMDQTSQTNPGVHMGSKYGTVMGLRYSGRIEMRNDPLVSFSPPSFSLGCGGIDVFTGSFSFTQPQYLKQKAERIMKGAVVYAFGMALDTLCPKCMSNVNKISNELNDLNNLQLDECAASKAVATYSAEFIGNIGEEVQENKVSTGTGDWHEEKDKMRSNGGAVTTAEVDDLIKNCDQNVKDVFGQSGSVLSHIGDKIGYPKEDIDFLRGMIGDVIIVKENGYTVKFDPPCPENGSPNLDNFIRGAAKHKVLQADGMTTICEDLTRTENGVTATLKDHSRNLMISIQDKMKNKIPLTQNELNALNASGMPIEAIMRMGVKIKQEAALADEYSTIVAMDRVNRMMEDTQIMTQQIVSTGSSIVSTATPKASGCKIQVMAGSMHKLVKLSQNAQRVRQIVKGQFAERLAETANRQKSLNQLKEFEKTAGKKLIGKFGSMLFKGGY